MRSRRGYLARIVPVERPHLPEGWRPGGGPPDWGLPEGERPEVEPPEPGEPGYPLPPDPPGIWPPLEGPDFPLFPVPPDGEWEPGEIWPPIRPPGGEGEGPSTGGPGTGGTPGQPLPKRYFFALVYLTGYGFKWVVVDLNAMHRPERPDRPEHPPAGGIGGRPPQRPGPEPERR